jgi:hypothetical protein
VPDAGRQRSRELGADAAARDRIVTALPRGQGDEFPGAHHFVVSHADEVGAALRAFLDAGDSAR